MNKPCLIMSPFLLFSYNYKKQPPFCCLSTLIPKFTYRKPSESFSDRFLCLLIMLEI